MDKASSLNLLRALKLDQADPALRLFQLGKTKIFLKAGMVWTTSPLSMGSICVFDFTDSVSLDCDFRTNANRQAQCLCHRFPEKLAQESPAPSLSSTKQGRCPSSSQYVFDNGPLSPSPSFSNSSFRFENVYGKGVIEEHEERKGHHHITKEHETLYGQKGLPRTPLCSVNNTKQYVLF